MEDPVEDTEEVVLSRWDKIKQWIEIAKAGKFLWILFFGVTGTAIVGQVTDTNPLQDAAIAVGLIDAAPIDTTKGMLREELMIQLATMQQEINELKSHELVTGPIGLPGKDGLNGKDGKNGNDGRDGKHGKDGSIATSQEFDKRFANHVDVLH